MGCGVRFEVNGPQNKKEKTMKKFAGFFITGVVSAAATLFLVGQIIDQPTTLIQNEQPPVGFTNGPLYLPTSQAPDFVNAAANSVNAVVHIKTQVKTNPVYNPWGDFFGIQPQTQIRQGSGSGVIIREDGYIITNNHVIEGAEEIIVSLNSNKSYTAKIIGTDPSTDLALVKIDQVNLPSMKFGDSETVQVGEWVLAVGNPFDLTSTVTAGIVSAKARNINLLRSNNPSQEIFPIESFIQTDAAVNPGNSGGALVNTRGELIGINTAIASRTGSYSGYSFAIPSSIVEKIVRDFIEFGDVQRAFIGVTISDVNEELAKEAKLKEVQGAYVQGLAENGAAEQAGISPGDIILSVESVPVGSVAALQEQVSKYRPGQEVNVGIWSEAKFKTVKLTLRGKEGKAELPKLGEVKFNRELGAALALPTKSELEKLNISGGARVAELKEGKLRSAGIKQGFIITKISDEPVRGPEDVEKIVLGRKGGALIEGIYPDGTRAFYGLGL